MKHVSNEEMAKEIAKCCSVMPPTPITQSDVLAMTNNAAMQAMEWKDKERKELWRITRNHYQEWAEEQIAKEKQKVIDEACKRLENFFAPDGSIVPENIRLLRDLQRVIKGEQL